MSITPLSFTGVSTYSSDLQTVLSRAVSIAQLPLKRLQNDEADIVQKKLLLGGLNTAAEDLGTSLSNLGDIASSHAIAASSSNAFLVSVVNTGANSAATYNITEITSLARAASETSVTGYADSTSAPISSTGTVNLVVGGKTYKLTLAADKNNLIGLRDAINNSGAGVTATILTTGTGPTPNFLSLSSNATGATTLQLNDDPAGANTNLLTSSNQGANAEFKLNGVPISKASNLINDVVAGATFTILGTSTNGSSATLTLTTDSSKISDALQDFATKYNTLVDQVGGQIGAGAGLLSGDVIVREVQNDLRQVGNYAGSGSIKSLADLGLEFSSSGKISFNSKTFKSLTEAQISDSFNFLGSSTSGFASLQKKFVQITDPVSGLVKAQLDNYARADTRIQSSMAKMTDQINAMQIALNAQLQRADSLLAQLTSQQSILDGSLKSAALALYGKQNS
jgi:flagellar hook-associated protein 2